MTIQQKIQGGETLDLSRRSFLTIAGGAGVGLMIGLKVDPAAALMPADPKTAITFNPFVKVSPDGAVTVIVKHLDKGQGVATGLATIVAEEMDADWATIRTEFAPANPNLYANLAFKAQGTGGSTSIANSGTSTARAPRGP